MVDTNFKKKRIPANLNYASVSLIEVLNNKCRFEASTFSLEGKKAKEIVVSNEYGWVFLLSKEGLVEDAFYPGRFKRTYTNKNNGVAFYLPSQLAEVFPKPSKFISNKDIENLKSVIINKDYLLLTRSGTIGKCTISHKTNIGKIYSDDIIRVSFKDKYDLGFTYAFLQTEVGQAILKTNNYGAVVSHIEPEHLENIAIPNPPNKIKKIIHEHIIESYNLRDKSNEFIDKAEQILYESLDLKELDKLIPKYLDNTKDPKCFQVKLSEMDSRFDGSYHLPIIKQIEKSISKNSKKIIPLGSDELTKEIILPNRFSRTYVDKEEGIQFLGGRDLFQLNPTTEKFLSKSIHKKQIAGDLKIDENDILTPSRGSIGRILLAPNHFKNKVISDNIINIKPANDEISGYLYCFLNSAYGYFLIKRQIYGSVVDAMEPSMLSKINIPILKDKKKQEKINRLILDANNFRYKAYLEEKKAIDYINDKILKIFSK